MKIDPGLPPEGTARADEVRRLRACVRDLVSLSALAALWVGRTPAELAEALADIVRHMLDLDVAAVRLVGAPGDATSEVVRRAPGGAPTAGGPADGVLLGWLALPDAEPPALPADPGGAPLRLARVPIGLGGESGALAGGARRLDFPSETDRLLLGVAANQAAVLMQAARLARERAARVRAEAALQLRDEFLARASHELRTPLTVVRGHVGLLVKRLAEADGDAVRMLEVARRHVEQMVRLVADLLDASRLEAGGVLLDPEPVGVGMVVAQALGQVEPIAVEKPVAVVADAVPPGLVLTADALMLEQILVNLLINAVKYTPPGGRVSVEAAPSGGEVEIRVRDTGQGIAPEHLDRIFEPFFQVGSAAGRRKATGEGAGLGLAIVRRLVELHGGQVRAESDGPGRGATFVVRLPAARS